MLTYQDLVDHLITASFGGPQDAEQKDIRSAVQRAVQEVAYIRDWRWYHTHGRIIFNDTWEGNVTYALSSGTFTRSSGDSFPSWAGSGRMRVDEVVSRIASMTNSNTLVADSTIRHPEDIVSPVPATLYRSYYPLPDDFRNLDSPIDQNFWTHFVFVEPDLAMKMELSRDRQGPPHAWTVRRDPQTNKWAIQVIGYPVEVETLDFTYRRAPTTPRLSGYEATSRQGTVSFSGTSISGTGTAFSSSMVGSVIRLGTASDYPEPNSSMTPYVHESRITAVSGSSLTMELPYTGGSGAVKYVITDPVDCSPGMENCMYSAAEYWLARIRKNKADDAFALYQRDLRLAFESDQVAPMSGTQRVIWDTTGWRTPLQADNFDGGTP